MAITTINSASSLYEGSSAADDIQIESGAASFTTVNAAGGNDTVAFVAGSSNNGASTTALSVDLNAGADEINLEGALGNGGNFDATIVGGAGGDTITFSGLDFVNGSVVGGDGNDLLSLDIAAISGTTVNLGAGVDTLLLSGAEGGVTALDIRGGSGADEITIAGDGVDGDISATTLYGGGGADLITISGEAGAGSFINGDSTVNGGGADTITINGAQAGEAGMVISGADVTIKGKGGADEIDLNGNINGNSARIEGNAGADLIDLSGAFLADNTFIGGGSGNDTLLFATGGDGSAATIQGGGGADFIQFNGTITGDATLSGAIYGGAGADTIDLGLGVLASGAAISLAELGDSGLTTIDEISTDASIVSGLTFNLDTAAGITSFTVGVYTDSDETTPSVTAGIVSGATFASADSGVTARVEELDGILSTKGTLVSFTAQGEDYIFIQGGESGTADDGVIEVQSGVEAFNVDTDYQFGASI